ncbi:pickpocket protein 28-like [Epargyreus clarus]|uniref:pickpocket protein 28-like n=1 Tax=Epargyreus clarus TaxID=520877 RepID=UPI003C304391
MFILCVIYCAILIRKVWIKWDESPVMVSFAESLTPAWQIPYPAITICFQIKAYPDRFNYTEFYHLYMNETTKANLTEEETQCFEDFSMICDDSLDQNFGKQFTDGTNTVGNIKLFSANFGDFSSLCLWKNWVDCQELFSPVITEKGLCHTFNALGPDQLFRMEKAFNTLIYNRFILILSLSLHKDYEYMQERYSNSTQSWTLEAGYPPSTPLETYPYRGSGNGGEDNLEIFTFTMASDLDYVCNFKQGIKIFLHSPAELPRVSRHYINLPQSHDVMIAVKPKMIITAEGLRPYSPIRRKCYFSNERYLQYFKIYTQTNCEIECLTNFTQTKCGCVHFGLPHGPGTKVCAAGSILCMSEARRELMKLTIESGMNVQPSDNDTTREARAVAARCRCLPACTSIEYEAETSQATVDEKAVSRAYKYPMTNEMAFLTSRVKIYLKESQFTTLRRSELFGQVDFLANCGGLLGLLMGFSVLSVVEIIYFLTLRWWCLFRKRQHNLKEFNKKQQVDTE